ncbi:MAG: hypothetical protein DRI73_09915 [Bacteroidetes bacterium]|nr:MAG: hypothetical protein DRI73_09915 [Bacteroidota bacterium]
MHMVHFLGLEIRNNKAFLKAIIIIIGCVGLHITWGKSKNNCSPIDNACSFYTWFRIYYLCWIVVPG